MSAEFKQLDRLADQVRRRYIPARMRHVLHSLFGSIKNTVLTISFVVLLAITLPPLFRWAVLESVWLPADRQTCIQSSGACWAFIQSTVRVILFGRYPFEEQWRPLVAAILLFGAIAISADWRQWARPNWMRFLIVLWVIVIFIGAVLMAGGLFGLEIVGVDRWSGLPLTLILATFGITSAFLMAIILALGRASNLPVFRWISVGFIELIRGVPLVTILFMAVIMLPLLLPRGFLVPNLLSAQLAFSIFFSVYMAEVIRGGLQGIPKGQYDAIDALGLTYWQGMRRIILPQALRTTIPSMINVFINALKDTSLVVIISMLDLLGTTRAVTNDPAWFGLFVEAYVFTAAIYFLLCSVMSWYSQRLEKYLRTGRSA